MSFHKQQKCFGLQTLTPPLIKAPEKNVEIWSGRWGGGGGDDVEKGGRTSGKILATPLRVSFRNGEQRLFFVPEGSVITHRTSFELLSKILRNLCESDRIN